MEVYDADGYKQWIRRYLDRLSPALENQLQTILSYRFHPQVVLLDTEIFPDGLREGIPIRMFLIDKHNSEVFHSNPAYFLPSSISLLEDIKEVIPQSQVDRQQLYQDAGIDTLDIEMGTLVEWFTECWIRADGRQCKLPAYICYHDDNKAFDLRQMKWVANVHGKWAHFTQD
ncbi:MAG: hypothetical protein ACXVA4_10455 [Ktedonobacterales bacterium]